MGKEKWAWKPNITRNERDALKKVVAEKPLQDKIPEQDEYYNGEPGLIDIRKIEGKIDMDIMSITNSIKQKEKGVLKLAKELADIKNKFNEGGKQEVELHNKYQIKLKEFKDLKSEIENLYNRIRQ